MATIMTSAEVAIKAARVSLWILSRCHMVLSFSWYRLICTHTVLSRRGDHERDKSALYCDRPRCSITLSVFPRRLLLPYHRTERQAICVQEWRKQSRKEHPRMST